MGFVKVFSGNLADAAGSTASQVRKDFSIFGISGNKRGGYKIDELIEKISSILGKDRVEKVIVVGAGHIGGALMRYSGFEKEGIKIVAGFDIESSRYSRDTQIPVLPIEELKDFVKKEGIKIGIIAVPEVAALQVADMLFTSGIKGILNFAPIRLKAPEDVVVNNVNVELELENLIYYVNILGKDKLK